MHESFRESEIFVYVWIRKLISPFRFILPFALVSYWFSTRRWMTLIYGLPAIAGAILLAIVACYSVQKEKRPTGVKQLLGNAIAARNNGDGAIADMYIKKARMLETDNPITLFDQAKLLLRVDETVTGVKIMKSLAPLGKPGFVPAREWLIEMLNIELVKHAEIENPTENQMASRAHLFHLFRRHCEQLLAESPDHPLALERLAMVRLDQNRITDAIILLKRLRQHTDKYRFQLAQLLEVSGRPEEALLEFEAAEKYHFTILEDGELPDKERNAHRIKLAICLAAREEFRDAAETLLNGDKAPKDPVMARLLSQILFNWSESFEVYDQDTKQIDEKQLRRRLNVLELAIRLRPGDPRFLVRLGSIAGLQAEASEKAIRILRQLAKDENASWVIHFALGITAVQKGNLAESKRHFVKAESLNPDSPVVLNNLAYVMSHGNGADPNTALDKINRAIEMLDEHSEFYDTRGTVYLALKRWEDAIADFQRAMKLGARRTAKIHQSLAIAYMQLGDQHMSNLHREHASKIRNSKREVR